MVSRIRTIFLAALAWQSAAAFAQDTADIRQLDTVVVVGSQIVGADIGGALPVTVLNAEQIEATGAVNGDELLRSIPQLGQVIFGETNFVGVNGARGDVGSINLRGIGTGNTLVLLNGRRLVLHPGTQVENLVPVNTVNSNALPVTGIERLEVLRDGASALYGTDAVAGVINTVLQDDFEGLSGQLRYGRSEGTSLGEFSGTVKFGTSFNQDQTNVSVFANFLDRTPMPASERAYSASDDLRPLFVGTSFEGNTQLRNLRVQTQFGEFRSLEGAIEAIGDDDFHIQPESLDGCLVALPNGVCADNGGSIDTALRLDAARYRDLVGDTKRRNLLFFANHEFDNGTALFAEASYYHADFTRQRETAQILSSNRIVVPAAAFHNPFGVNIRIMDYRPLDAGPRMAKVVNDSYRLLGGARGEWNSWNWEAAALYSAARTDDTTNRVSNTLFQQAISRTTADGYNPFAGGDITDINAPNTTANSPAVIAGFLVPVSRIGSTRLALADAKVSNGALYTLPGGDLGIAIGVEWRQEGFTDDRDDRLDGTITFTDSVTGITNLSDVMGSSPTPDTNGDRQVLSAFAELAVPLVGEDMGIPFVERLDMQVAARVESYSDVGSVAKPKIALSWYPIPSIQVRGAWSEGFRAPNLEQINAEGIRRVNTNREDWILCAANALANSTDFSTDDCDSFSVESVRGGGPDLRSEANTNYSLGVVFTPDAVPDLTVTLDWWRIEQTDVIGIFGDQNQISLDYLLRLEGSSNPNVVRATPNADDIALYTAAGLEPTGEILFVTDEYTNLTPRVIQGVDIGLNYKMDTDAGHFNLALNAAYLATFFQNPSVNAARLLAAVGDGTINSAVDVAGAEDLIRRNGHPHWRATANLTWQRENFGAGAFYRYVGDVYDSSTTDSDGLNLPIDAFQTLSLYVEYTLAGAMESEVRLRLGGNNIFNQSPPLADEFGRGYFSTLHSNRGRYWYASIRTSF